MKNGHVRAKEPDHFIPNKEGESPLILLSSPLLSSPLLSSPLLSSPLLSSPLLSSPLLSSPLLSSPLLSSPLLSSPLLSSPLLSSPLLSSPLLFINNTGVKAILSALKGDSNAIARNGVSLGGDGPPCTPGKLEVGSSLFGSNCKGGGCAVYQCEKTILIGFYPGQPEICVRLLRELSEHITQEHH